MAPILDMPSAVLRRLVVVSLVIAIGAVAVAAGPVRPAAAGSMGPDYLTSDNVEFVKTIRSPSGLTAGARIIGKYMYVTSSKDLEIFDISKPEDPQMVGSITANIQFENEEVPTNGKLLGISSDLLHSSPQCLAAAPSGLPADGGCLRLYDVRDPQHVQEVAPVPGAGDHTSTCVLDCTYFYGSAGTITDARTALDPGGQAKIVGNWKKAVRAQGYKFAPNPSATNPNREVSCHNLNEVRPGILIASCQPVFVLSVNAEDGGSPLAPKVLASGSTPQEPTRFIHSARWPRGDQDRFALIGGETNFQPQCGPKNGAFMTFDASHALQDGRLTEIDEIRPVGGYYLDSNPPAQILGCSVHWFEEHSTFHDGGLVALAEYENGTRFLQIQADGKIKEQGYFVPLGGSTSAPHWAPGSDIVYAVDYERGIDVLRYKGSHYVPGSPPEPDAVPGTEGLQPQPPAGTSAGLGAVCASDAGFSSALARPVSPAHGAREADEGSGSGLRFVVSRRQSRPFSVAVFQTSQGRRVLRERRVARFANRSRSFTWSGRGQAGQGVTDGSYFARFTMRLADGHSDVRRVTLVRRHGRFSGGPAFYLRDTCGALRSFKLQRPVFGGRTRERLGIAYRLTRGVDRVTVIASVDGKVVRRFKDTGRTPGRTYRLTLPSGVARRGRDVRVRIVIRRANAEVSSTLTSHRL